MHNPFEEGHAAAQAIAHLPEIMAAAVVLLNNAAALTSNEEIVRTADAEALQSALMKAGCAETE